VLITVVIYFVLGRKKISFKHILLFIIIVILVSSPWYLIELINKGPWFIVEFFQYQLELFSKPVAGHSQPLYYHFLVVLIGCFPFSFYGFKNSFRDSGFGIDFEKMMRILLWVVLILFTIVTTKIAHYSSMAYLPLSFLASIELFKIYNGKKFNSFLKYSLIIVGSFIGLILMSALFVIINHKDLILTIVKDSNTQYLLQNQMQWLGWEWLIPVLIIVGSLFSCLFLNSRLIPSLILYSIAMGLNFSLLCKFVVPNIENVIQGSAVSFYEDISSEKKYLTTVGFKSYAHYFYSKIDLLDSKDSLYNAKKKILKTNFNSLSLNELSSEDKTRFNNYVLSWYINGNIDRPVYFATKKNKINSQLEAAKNLIVIKDFGGFKFYKRELK
jgi:4-amino-4-deoxy-L-arabinose transferase-like glycosyltransferase